MACLDLACRASNQEKLLAPQKSLLVPDDWTGFFLRPVIILIFCMQLVFGISYLNKSLRKNHLAEFFFLSDNNLFGNNLISAK